ncbi:MAG: MFS transporter [Candidatus Cloacimonadaceae bacterium]
MRFKNLNPLERQTARLLLWSALFNGLVMSLNQTQDIIARKALAATAVQLTIMAMVWPVSNFMSIWWGRLFERSSHKSRYFIFVGIFGRLSLIYGLWLSGMNEFMLLLALMFSFNALLIPAQNSIYQRNIDPKRRSKVYGYTISLGMLVAVSFTFLAGRWLDLNENAFRWILAITAVAGFTASVLLSLIKIREPEKSGIIQPLYWKDVVRDPVRRSLSLLKENKPFASFERSFSIYGMGFIMIQPVLPIFLVDMLKLSYTGNFVAKGIISQIPLLLLSPVLGKWHDKLHPFRFIGVFFGVLALFPLMIILSALTLKWHLLSVILVYLAYVIFGLAMVGVNIAWNMSSIFFAGSEDASMYQSVHVTLTGIRGVIAPLLGLLLLKTTGLISVFAVSSLFLMTASYLSWRDFKRLQI